MKKAAIFITIMSILFSFTMVVSADSEQKTATVNLSEVPSVINVGETLAITATTQKHGSSYTDYWSNAMTSITTFDSETECYVSEAMFTAEKPGVYVISYTINMNAGKNGTVFSSTVEKTIEVVDTVTLVGALIKDLTIVPIVNESGVVLYYRASGIVHALWSDNTTTPNNTIYFFFGPNERSKDLDVTLNVEGKQYQYKLTVNR